MKPWIQTAIFAAMLFAANSGILADDTRPGDRVAAIFRDGEFHLATVTAVRDGKIEVLYDIGEKAVLAPVDVKGVSRAAIVNVGTPVLAAWKTAQMFPGVVTARTDVTVTVRWDDGDEPTEVARDRIVVLHRAEAEVPAAGRLPVGISVAAKWGFGSYYIATITGVEANGKYSVKYGDGETGVVGPGDVKPVNPAREIAIGAHVLAVWQGAAMYPGTVTAKRDNSYTVKWDDGDTPLEVTRDRIAPLSER